MKRIVWAVLLLLVTGTALAAKPLTPDSFTKRFISAFQEAEPDIPLEETGTLALKITLEDGSELSIYLDNAYQLYLSEVGTSQEVISQHIASISETLNNNNIDAPLDIKQVLPVIKSRDYLEMAQAEFSEQNSKSDEPTLQFLALNQDLVVLYALDTPTSMRYLSPADLAKLDLDENALHSQAIINLQRYFEQQGGAVQQLETDGQGQIFVISIDEIYEGSIILLDIPQDQSLFPVAGEPVVFLPARGTVLVAGSEDQAGLQLASHIARLAFEDMGYSISPHGYRLTDKGWLRYR